jgi:hypothetical protein
VDNRGKRPQLEVVGIDDTTIVNITRGRKITELVRFGANKVHAAIIHTDGSIEDLGVSENLLTNIGRDWLADAMGGKIPAGGAGSPATATSATSFTATGTPWTASNLATPQLGLIGMRAYFPVTNITTAPVYGNIVSNTTSVATIDQWWTAADGTGTTPASTNAFILGAGGPPSTRFMGLTTDASAASAADTALATEITANGANRQLATYAHTYGNATYTLTKAYSITGTITAIHKGGLFTHNSQAGTGPVIFETVLNQDATVGNGDTLTVTWTVTLSG